MIEQMPLVLKIALIAVVASAAFYDVRTRKIPNWLNLSGLVLGLGLNTLLLHAHGIMVALLGLGLSLLIYIPLYLIRGMGAGDVKLMAAVGSIAGPQNWLIIFVVTAIWAGSPRSHWCSVNGESLKLWPTCQPSSASSRTARRHSAKTRNSTCAASARSACHTARSSRPARSRFF